MLFARAGHSATMLPNGKVMVMGGIGTGGSVVAQAELFDPNSQSFAALSSGPTPRAYHTATLLTDGRVAIIGGVDSDGNVLATIALWDFRNQQTAKATAQLDAARWNHTAILCPDGTVLVSGGLDANGKPVATTEVFDPQSLAVGVQAGSSTNSYSTTTTVSVVASLPSDGAVEVPLDSLIALRFSAPIQVQSVSQASVTLSGLEGIIEALVVPAEDGRLAFLTPNNSLLPGSTYTVSVSGVLDSSGNNIAAFQASFTTAGQPLPPDGEQWVPDASNFNGDWRSGRAKSAAESQASLYAREGQTAVSGLVLTLDGRPLANVTLQIGTNRTRSDGTGRFLLTSAASGHQVLLIDGTTANTPHKVYGLFEDGIDIKQGHTNVLPYTIWMPLLDMAHAVKIPSPTTSETVVTTPLIPGLELHLPPGTVIYDRQGKVVTQVSITPVPIDRPAFPLPFGLNVPTYFTIQPGSAYVRVPGGAGARLIYPNYVHLIPKSRSDFWNYDPNLRGWFVYGKGTVNASATQIIPDPGVMLYEFTGAMISPLPWGSPPAPPPARNPKADPVDPSTGLFIYQKTDLFLSDVISLSLTRAYRQADPTPRAFGIGTNHPYDIFLSSYGETNFYQADVILADGTDIHYVCQSNCSSTDPYDELYQNTTSPTAFYGSQLNWNGNGWTVALKDGTKYNFPWLQSGINSIQDRYGNTITIDHDGNERVTKVTSPNGRWLQFSYESTTCKSCATAVTDNIGRKVAYAYDAQSRLTSVTDANGGVWQYTYDSNNEMTSITDPKGIVYLSNQYDSNGRVTLQTEADGSTYQFSYQSAGSLNSPNYLVTQATITDPRGDVEQMSFNASGYASYDTRAANVPGLSQTTAYFQNPICSGSNANPSSNVVTNVIDALSRQTYYAYDCMGNLTSVTQLAGTGNAVTTSFTYDPKFNQLTSITDPLGHQTTFTRDNVSNLTAIVDALQDNTTFTYNSEGQVTSITDGTGQNTAQFSYDPVSADLIGITDPAGQTTLRFVDGAGRLVAVTNPLGQRTTYQYDALNQVLSITDPLQGVTSFGYDGNGNLLTVTDANHNSTAYGYNNMDRPTNRTDPLGRTESFQYDLGGNLVQFTDRRGKVAQYGYDALNRITSVQFGVTAPNTYESQITYAYDAGNRPTQISDSAAGNITPQFDGLDRLTQEATPQGSVSYTYDLAGRRSAMTVQGQPAISYTYDNANRLTQISQGTTAVSFAYDAANRRTALTLPNGVTVAYGYDQDSRIAGMTYTAGSTALGNLTYAYDAASRRTQVGGSFAQTNLPQPVAAASYDAANELLQWGSSSLAYDSSGNLVNDGVNQYAWNARNQLVSMSGSTTAAFQYDAHGRRISKTIAGATTGFLYDGVNAAQELSGTTPTANMLSGGVDEIFMRTDSTGAYSFLADGLGSTVGLADSSGVLQTQYTYEPFGNTTVAGTSSNSFQYTGRENEGTGLYFYRARYYNPQLGRFISEDPLGFAGGDGNLYAYVFNSPTNFFDPIGLDAWTSFGGGVRAVGGLFEAGAGFGFGAATSWTGIGAVAGAAVGLHGLDEAQAGLRQLFSGCHVDSFTSQGLQGIGLSQSAANLTDAGISVLGSLGTGVATQAIEAGGLQNIFYYEAGQSTMSSSEFAESAADPVERGMQRVADQGWLRSLFSGLGAPSQFAKTIPKGLTPLGNGALGAVGGTANALSGRDCGCGH